MTISWYTPVTDIKWYLQIKTSCRLSESIGSHSVLLTADQQSLGEEVTQYLLTVRRYCCSLVWQVLFSYSLLLDGGYL